jgi:hypothetical protein
VGGNCRRDRGATCRPGIGPGTAKSGLNFPAFGPNVCLWPTHSALKNHSCFPQPALPFLTAAHFEAPIWPLTVDLEHANLSHLNIHAS